MLTKLNDVLCFAVYKAKPKDDKKGYQSYAISYKDDDSGFYTQAVIYEKYGETEKMVRGDKFPELVVNMRIYKGKVYFGFVEALEQKSKKVA